MSDPNESFDLRYSNEQANRDHPRKQSSSLGFERATS